MIKIVENLSVVSSNALENNENYLQLKHISQTFIITAFTHHLCQIRFSHGMSIYGFVGHSLIFQALERVSEKTI